MADQAGVSISLSAGNAEVANVVVGSTVVQQLAVQQTLHGLNVGISIDGGAVFPDSVGVQVDDVSEALGSGFGNAELGVLSLDLLGHVNGQSSSHLRDDDVALVGVNAFLGMQLVVEVEAVQTNAQEICGIGIIGGLVGVGVPVGSQGHNGILPGVGCGSLRSGLNGSSTLGGSLSLGGVAAACSQGQNHGQSEQQGQKLFHFFSSFLFIYS